MYPSFRDKQKTLFKRAKELRRKATASELAFEKKLQAIGVKYIFQKCFIQGDYYCIVDFYLPKPYKTCIEIDGGYHNEESQVLKDGRKDKYLTEDRRFNVLRLTNYEAETLSIEAIRQLLK